MPRAAKNTAKGGGAKVESLSAAVTNPEALVKPVEIEGVNQEPVKVITPVAPKAHLTTDMLIPCMSNVSVGKLVYASKRQNGYVVEWSKYTEIQYIELGELVAMKSTALGFFTENLIIIPDEFEYKDEVLKYLHVERYYENAAEPGSMKKLLNAPIDAMVKRIEAMGEVSKKSLTNYVINAVESGEIDSLKRIKALEEALDCKLT